ncbi:hypothetical protein V5O48_015007 [Marasmius crinis-equi]|uniref:F-box domain-containing protein n=1 Tax=Marasmius crinis-equi TaxID=585013 RepID=A0ABR3EVQ6_9AGAR
MSLIQARERLLHEESTLLHHLSLIRSQLNHLVPVSALPTEVLTYIFSFCIVHPSSRSLSKPNPSTTLAFTQVCRAWRTLAISSPCLWSTIDVCHDRFASLCLSRCGGANISLIAPTSRIAFEGSLVAVRNQIRKIDLVLFPDAMLRLFKRLIMGMENIEWELEPGFGMGTGERLRLENMTELDLRLPSIAERLDLYFLDLPSIQKVSLDNVTLDWGALARDNRSGKLKSLSLSRVRLEMDELLGLIAQSEEVMLEAVHVDEMDSEKALISTPTLRKITIISRNKAFVDGLLSRITLGEDTAVVIRCMEMRVSVMGHQIPDALAAAFQQHSSWIVGNMGISPDVMGMMGYPYHYSVPG